MITAVLPEHSINNINCFTASTATAARAVRSSSPRTAAFLARHCMTTVAGSKLDLSRTIGILAGLVRYEEIDKTMQLQLEQPHRFVTTSDLELRMLGLWIQRLKAGALGGDMRA